MIFNMTSKQILLQIIYSHYYNIEYVPLSEITEYLKDPSAAAAGEQ